MSMNQYYKIMQDHHEKELLKLQKEHEIQLEKIKQVSSANTCRVGMQPGKNPRELQKIWTKFTEFSFSIREFFLW